jgi:hypothetical protein
MVMAKDFVGVVVWAILIAMLYLLNRRYKKLSGGDFVFLSMVLLITIELLWLRYGY